MSCLVEESESRVSAASSICTGWSVYMVFRQWVTAVMVKEDALRRTSSSLPTTADHVLYSVSKRNHDVVARRSSVSHRREFGSKSQETNACDEEGHTKNRSQVEKPNDEANGRKERQVRLRTVKNGASPEFADVMMPTIINH
jgi:hypothetical protein